MQHTFSAFLSHSSKDRALVRRLQQHLEQAGAKLGVRVFRDETDMASRGIWHELDAALLQSRTLILCASPAAQQSSYVADELQRFRALRPDGEILVALVRGDERCIPDSLASIKYGDLRSAFKPWNRLFIHDEVLRLAAAVLQVPLRHLIPWSRRRLLRWLGAMGVVAGAAAALFAVQQAQLRRSQADALIAAARDSLQLAADKRSALQYLWAAQALSAQRQFDYALRFLYDRLRPVESSIVAGEGRYVVVDGATHFRAPGLPRAVDFAADSHLVAGNRDVLAAKDGSVVILVNNSQVLLRARPLALRWRVSDEAIDPPVLCSIPTDPRRVLIKFDTSRIEGPQSTLSSVSINLDTLAWQLLDHQAVERFEAADGLVCEDSQTIERVLLPLTSDDGGITNALSEAEESLSANRFEQVQITFEPEQASGTTKAQRRWPERGAVFVPADMYQEWLRGALRSVEAPVNVTGAALRAVSDEEWNLWCGRHEVKVLLASDRTRSGWIALVRQGPDDWQAIGASGPASSQGLLVSPRCDFALDLATGRIGVPGSEVGREAGASAVGVGGKDAAVVLPGFGNGVRIAAAAISPSGRQVVVVNDRGGATVLVRGDQSTWHINRRFLAPPAAVSSREESFALPVHIQRKGAISIDDDGSVLVLDAIDRLTHFRADGIVQWQAVLPQRDGQTDGRSVMFESVRTPHLYFVRRQAAFFVIDRLTGMVLEQFGGCDTATRLRLDAENEVHLPCEHGSQLTEKDLSAVRATDAGIRERTWTPLTSLHDHQVAGNYGGTVKGLAARPRSGMGARPP